MADIETFRTRISKWIDDNAPAALRGKVIDPEASPWGGRRPVFKYPESKTWLEVAAAEGLTAPNWPKEYGGGGLDKEQTKVFNDELRARKLPPPLQGFGLTMIGPTLLQFGTEEQKKEHLPRICRGEIRWCQGYSEPNAGSDLASLQTTAVRDGDDFIINGQKVWTSYGDLSDWMFMLVRTDPEAKKQAGITFILVDLDTPGIEIKPIKLISGASPFCESFFSDVRVPVKNSVSKINNGWTVAKALLGHERTMIASIFGGSSGATAARRNTMIEEAKQRVGLAGDQLADGELRARIVQQRMDQLCFNLTTQRNQDSMKAGHEPGPESSLFKIYGTELNQRREELMLSIRGPRCLGWEGRGYEAEELEQTRSWLRSRGNTIEGGTSEVQLNIIAKRVLGLPD